VWQCGNLKVVPLLEQLGVAVWQSEELKFRSTHYFSLQSHDPSENILIFWFAAQKNISSYY